MGRGRDALDGGLADATARGVDHTQSRYVVCGVYHALQVGHDIAYLGAVEKARAPHQSIRHASAQEHVLQRAALRVRAVEDGHVVVGDALIVQALYLACDPAPLVALVACAVAGDGLAFAAAREQLLVLAVGVVRDHGVCRVEYGLRRAIVFLQLHRGRVRPVALEVEDVAYVGAAPRVDGLVVVAHHHEVAVTGGKALRDGVLRAVRVLVLVDEYVGEALLIGPRDIRKALQQKPSVVEQIVEIHGVSPYEALLVHGKHPRRHGVLEAFVR